MRDRIYRFDNCKFILMILVITVHCFVSRMPYTNSNSAEALRFVCLVATMPLFAFISGWFSSSRLEVKKIVGLAVVTVFFNTVDAMVYSCVTSTPLDILEPSHFFLWYLWALLAYRLVLPAFIRIPFPCTISFVMSFLFCFWPGCLAYFVTNRIVGFFPFYMLGYVISHNEKCSRLKSLVIGELSLKKRVMVCMALIIILAIGAALPFFTNVNLNYGLRLGHVVSGTGFRSLFGRVLFYSLSMVTGWMFLQIVPRRRNRFTILGQRTLQVYVLHAYPVAIAGLMGYMYYPNMYACLAISVLAFSMCMLLFARPVGVLVKSISDVSLRLIK